MTAPQCEPVEGVEGGQIAHVVAHEPHRREIGDERIDSRALVSVDRRVELDRPLGGASPQP